MKLATDDAWMGNTGQSTDGFSPASEYLITPNRMGYLTDLFKERYKNIMACNIAINSIPEAPISEDKKSLMSVKLYFVAHIITWIL